MRLPLPGLSAIGTQVGGEKRDHINMIKGVVFIHPRSRILT